MQKFFLLPALMLFFCAASVCAISEEDEYMREYNRSKKIIGLNVGGGIGAKYGGWFGAGGTFDVGYIGLSLGSGILNPNVVAKSSPMGETTTSGSYTTLGWQAALRIYFAGIKETVRPGLNIAIGNVYPYQINYNDYESKGLFIGYTPSIVIEHDVGAQDGFTLSYGLGVVLHEAIGEKDKGYVRMVTKKDEILNLSLVFGINYAIF